jgi:hypothetical protein
VSHLPCPSCQRHVRLSDTACPFCATILPLAVPSSSAHEPAPRLGRIAVLAAGAAMMAGLAACDDPAQPKTGTGGASATGGKGGVAGASATGGKGGAAGASATGGKGGAAGASATGGKGGTAGGGTGGAAGAGGGAGGRGTGGAAGSAGGTAGSAATGGTGGVPVAIYAAAVALPSNTA